MTAGALGVKTGHGFHTWTGDEVKAVIARRDTALIEYLARDNAPRAAGSADSL